MKSAVLLVMLAVSAYADIYMMNPRGSNNRCDEQSNDTNNANRIFDSQNNSAGGFCVAHRMSFYQGSTLMVEWTSQHACGTNGKSFCNYVVQIGCENTFGETPEIPDVVRDGRAAATNTECEIDPEADPNNIDDDYCHDNAGNQNQCTGRIDFNEDQPPTTPEGAATARNPDTGRSENWYNYQWCQTAERNRGLLLIDENLNGDTKIYTRQNEQGTRHGYECNEERDYYPYWHPTPWMDIAVMTNQMELCNSGYYQGESQNVKAKNYCDNGTPETPSPANNEEACEAEGSEWKSQEPWNMPEPECIPAPWNRDNHLGSKSDGYMNNVNITLPRMFEGDTQVDRKRCQLRLRYNISTADYDAWNPEGIDPEEPFEIEVGPSGTRRNFIDDPLLENLGDPNNSPQGDIAELQLAIDTGQFARTFQDRSYVFELAIRPDSIADTEKIWNLNVRGKKGNIAQVRNCVEYDFTPNRLNLKKGDYIHYQWTGCNYNPAGNAGEGRNRLDRSNMCQIENWNDNFPLTLEEQDMFDDYDTAALACLLNQTYCLTEEETNGDQDVRNCAKLNGVIQPRFYDDIGTFPNGEADDNLENSGYFNIGALRQNRTGTYLYMSTRNQNFTNRSQKGMITVGGSLSPAEIALIALGAVAGFIIIVVGTVYGLGRLYPDSVFGNILAKFQRY